MGGQRVELNIHPLTRVEGHGRVYVKVKDGRVEEITLAVVESPRFFMVGLALKVKGVANRVCEAIAGRHIHPISFVVGGSSYVPERKVLLGLRDELEKALGVAGPFHRILPGKGLPIP